MTDTGTRTHVPLAGVATCRAAASGIHGRPAAAERRTVPRREEILPCNMSVS